MDGRQLVSAGCSLLGLGFSKQTLWLLMLSGDVSVGQGGSNSSVLVVFVGRSASGLGRMRTLLIPEETAHVMTARETQEQYTY